MRSIFIYCADVYCEECGKKLCESIPRPEHAGELLNGELDQRTYDSDEYPKECDNGESDCPAHCANCGEYLDSPLTSTGVDYVLNHLKDYVNEDGGTVDVLDTWAADLKNYGLSTDQKFVLTAYDNARELDKWREKFPQTAKGVTG